MSGDNLNPAAPAGAHDDAAVARANFGAAVGSGDRHADADAKPFTTVAFDLRKALGFLKACETSQPRVGYGLGAKCASGAVPGRDFTAIDCSGFVRECMRRATNLGNAFPDGSVVQHDWVRAHGFQTATVASGSQRDGAVRIAFLPPTKTRVGHVAILHDGQTLESHGGVGPDSRPWTGQAWQAETEVFVLQQGDAAAADAGVSLATHLASIVVDPQPSEKAVELIVFFEVSDRRTYERDDRHTTWPGGASGVTIGIGYDVGYVTAVELGDDWRGVIPDAMLAALGRAVGVQGLPAKTIAEQLASLVDVSWDSANHVFRAKNIPVLSRQVAAALPNSRDLSGDSFGALVSLAYNRGVSFDSGDARHAEMRNIKAHMQAKDFAKIPAEIRAMKRLWPTVPGLLARRDKEAALFEQGLVATA